MDYLTKFNDTFKEFIADLSVVFPNDPEFNLYKAAIDTAICLDENIAHDIFYKNVVELYGEKLLSKDEDFFLNHDYEAIVSVRSDPSKTNDIINKIKSYWKQLNEENRNTIWKYFRVLILLSKKINTN